MVSVRDVAEYNQRRVLQLLFDGPKTWKELLELTGFARGTLAKHLRRLLEMGLIIEEIDKKDRRVKVYKLSFNPDVITTLAIDFLALEITLTRFVPYIVDPPENDEELSDFLREVGNTMVVGAVTGGEAFKVSLKVLEMLNAIAEECADKEFKQHLKERWNKIWEKWTGIVKEALEKQEPVAKVVREKKSESEFEEFLKESEKEVIKKVLGCIKPAFEKITPIPIELFLND